MCMLVLCQNYTYILALSHTHTHEYHNISQGVPTIRYQLKAAYLTARWCEASGVRPLRREGNPTELSPSPRSFPRTLGKKNPNQTKTRLGNVRCGRLPPTGTGDEPSAGDRSPASGRRFFLLLAET